MINKTLYNILSILCMLILLPTMIVAQVPPAGFVPPALHPEGVILSTKSLGGGVYALQSSRPPADNAGFIVGDHGVLVIDAHIDKRMADQIIAAVRAVTDKPILYLVNTNGHADHTFGNYAFPPETKIIAHKLTKIMMGPDIETRKKGSLGMVRGDMSVFAATVQRMADITFADHMEIHLGAITVELHHFGGGNTPGDTVVYVPSTQTAWTGNLVLGAGSLPFLLIGDTDTYIKTINNFAKLLDVKTIIPGHGMPTNSDIFPRYIDYLTDLQTTVDQAHKNNMTLGQTLEKSLLPERFTIPSGLSSTAFYGGLHPFNIQKIFLEKKTD